ncbi:substrate-specific component BioY of biotin ECF transporter [Geomicrobium sp. JCM 19038]|nr:substrate-specific component BioY of biotin ECF transporter [Geomicrobium sp. JCM 19055]GAK08578.1 substrate-specific component BioY of biotin ECF transporter [Geomicrobium sp. JCM 19038]
MFVRPTFGFILSFIVVAFVVGKIIERKAEPTIKRMLLLALSDFWRTT